MAEFCTLSFLYVRISLFVIFIWKWHMYYKTWLIYGPYQNLKIDIKKGWESSFLKKIDGFCKNISRNPTKSQKI